MSLVYTHIHRAAPADAAIREGREPNASVAQVLGSYRTLHEIERQLVREASSGMA